MDNTFSIAQRQSSVGVLVEWLLLLKRNVRFIAAVTLYAFIKLAWTQYLWIIAGWIVLLTALAYVAYLKYRHLSFYINQDRNEFILEKGIWNKEQVIIQLDKIVQVNIEQHFAQRLVEVYAVSIDTAGSTQSEVKIPALDKPVAMALKQALMPQDVIPATDTISHTLDEHIAIPTSKLLLHALTADYFRNLLFLSAISFSFLEKMVNVADTMQQDTNEYQEWAWEMWQSMHIFFIITVLLFVPILFNLIRNVLTYFQMKITLQSASLLLSYGLINRKVTILNKERTQLFIRKYHPLQKFLGIEKLSITQLSSNIEYDQKAKVQIPGAHTSLSKKLFKHLYGLEMPAFEGVKLRVAPFAIISPILAYICLPYGIVWSLVWGKYIFIEEALWALFWLPLAILLVYRYMKGRALAISGNVILSRTTWWNLITKYTTVNNITKVQAKQYPWQRKRNVGSILLYTSGGQLTYSTKDYNTAVSMLNRWLYEIESTADGKIPQFE